MRLPYRARPPAALAASLAARRAVRILEAWDSGDRAQLAAELTQAATPGAKPPDSHEGERAELLAEAAADLRAMLAFAGAGGAAVPLRLLRHLAACQ